MLDRLRQQLAVVRELAVDQPRGQHDVAELEHDLILRDADRQRLAVGLLGDARELLQRTGGDVRLERALQRRSQSAASLTHRR